MSDSTTGPDLAPELEEGQDSPEPAWFSELLTCPDCGRGPLESATHCRWCPGCGSRFTVRNGINYLFSSDFKDTFAKNRLAWNGLKRARGDRPLSPEDALKLPEDAQTRDLLFWLRTRLAGDGPRRVLELGAGRGWAARTLVEDGHQVIASDAQDDDEIGLGFASRLRSDSAHWYACVVTGAESLPFQSGSFDCIYCFSTLRYIIDLERVLREVSRLLKPGGLFIALQEPFRGLLTTSLQRLQNSDCHKLARWWHIGPLPDGTASTLTNFRTIFGTLFHEVARRAPFCVASARELGLQATVLPVDTLSTIPPDGDHPESELLQRRGWLDAFAAAHSLEPARLRETLELTPQDQKSQLLSEFLGHWVHVGNIEGVLLARKLEQKHGLPGHPRANDVGRCRQLEQLLLACSSNNFLPIYGFYPGQSDEQGTYHWMQPRAGLIIPGCQSVEITVVIAARAFWSQMVRVDLHLEDAGIPLLSFVARPGATITVRVPIPKSASERPSLLLRLNSTIAFMPSDYGPALAADSRLLALQLRSVRPGNVQSSSIASLLENLRPAA